MPKNKQPKLLSPKPDEASPRRRPFYQHPLFYVFLLVILATGIIFAVKHFAKTTPPPPDNILLVFDFSIFYNLRNE